MIRKLTGTLLIGAICLLGIAPILAQEVYNLKDYEKLAGKKLTYNEAPELRVKVAAGELPPVEERLPEEPLVVKPIEEIGQYGGVWHRVCRGTWGKGGMQHPILWERLVRWNKDFTKIMPNVVKSWEFSKDGKSITFFLRKGMKWSDGAPFTADDFVFYWNDIALNKELHPLVPRFLSIGGEPGKIRKIDDYTFRLTFAQPYGMAIEIFASTYSPIIYAPKHYLKQFHPKYTPIEKIKKIIKEKGYDIWTDFFLDRNTRGANPKLPVIEAWYPIDEFGRPIQRFVRNPYYWKIDTEGNQLPYIDEIESFLVSDHEAKVLKAIAGDIDCESRGFGLDDYPLIMENRKKGDYRLIPSIGSGSNLGAFYFNFFNKDPILRKLFRDKRFRIALSVAINRDEINKLLFKGVGTPAQFSPAPGAPWYEERFEKAYIEYNPKRANELLDEIGLTKHDKEGYRLRSDGKRLRFIANPLGPYTGWTHSEEIMELCKGYWKKIGIEIVVKPISTKLWYARIKGCEYDITSHFASAGDALTPPVTRPEVFPTSQGWPTWPKWAYWFASGGKSGEEPPKEIKRLMEIHDEALGEPSTQKRIELMREAFSIHSKNLWIVGIIRPSPLGSYWVVKNNFRNLPEKSLCPQVIHFAQCFIKK